MKLRHVIILIIVSLLNVSIGAYAGFNIAKNRQHTPLVSIIKNPPLEGRVYLTNQFGLQGEGGKIEVNNGRLLNQNPSDDVFTLYFIDHWTSIKLGYWHSPSGDTGYWTFDGIPMEFNIPFALYYSGEDFLIGVDENNQIYLAPYGQ